MENNVLDNYIVLRTLGTGGYCKVKLVEDVHGRKFAAKLLKNSVPEKLENIEHYLQKEIQIVKQLNHINIIRIHSINKNGVYRKPNRAPRHVAYMIMEFCKNGSLFDAILSNGFMTEEIARMYFKKLVSALEHCHNQGIAHRDIKLENVLFDKNFNIKLIDFGFATRCGDPGKKLVLTSSVGTRGFMAPEVLLRKPYCGQEADVFSLGVVLFIMRSYNPPFVKAMLNDPYYSALINNEEEFWKLNSERKAPDHFSRSFRILIKGMLEHYPENRYTLEDIKASEWFNESD
jgi:serine/threonine protein kinase